jgi:acyl dehydratase
MPMPQAEPPTAAAPYFEDLRVGQVERSAPAVTLTSGLAATHQAIVGDRLRLALDAPLSHAVVGGERPLTHPALVWDLAIGQSTLLTGRVVANLFYRGLLLRRAPLIGDTLTTTTEVVGLRQTTPRAGRPATGLAALRILTVDQEQRPVLDFWRCAMLPLRDPEGNSGHDDSFDSIPAALDPTLLGAAVSTWDLEPLRQGRESVGMRHKGDPPPPLTRLAVGERVSAHTGDVVSAAPELARLTLNVAAVHHDRHAHSGERRLVYGGHTIGLAAAQATRAIPEIATIVGWHSCEHLAPVHEGDTLHSEVELEQLQPLARGGALAHLRSRVSCDREAEPRPVLDWRFVALVA